MSRQERKAKITPSHDLPVTRQCQILSISRSSAYYQPHGLSDEGLSLMRHLDALHLSYPFYGARRLRDGLLDDYGKIVNRKRVRRLMRLMGIRAIYPGHKGTSKPNKAHRVYPYLLADLAINRSNQVWCTDITYIPFKRGFLSLVAIMDSQRRKVLSLPLSNTLEPSLCIVALGDALARSGVPCIFHTVPGSPLTLRDVLAVLQHH